ncbi:MAG TPA: transposase, partial [Candidatus Sulfotelmatobacter sp.]|nr:transposase [Candidatus Sulfotelmatobacter sp.]
MGSLALRFAASARHEIVVCNPRKNALLNEGNKSDRIDARNLADLLRGNYLKPVYHGEHGLRMLKELSRTYLTVSKDLVRVMNRLKALVPDRLPRCRPSCLKSPLLLSGETAPQLPSFSFIRRSTAMTFFRTALS